MMELVFVVALLVLAYAAILGVASLSIKKSVSGLISGSESVTVTDATGVQVNPAAVLAAQPAILSVRTSGTVGTLTMTNAAHGLITGQRVDLYWGASQAYGAVLGTVSGVSVPIASVSGGTALPIATSVINVGIAVSSVFPCTGSNISGLALTTDKSGYFVFNDGSSDVYAAFVTAGRVVSWKTGDVNTNPLSGATPTKVYTSHSDTTVASSKMQAAAVTH